MKRAFKISFMSLSNVLPSLLVNAVKLFSHLQKYPVDKQGHDKGKKQFRKDDMHEIIDDIRPAPEEETKYKDIKVIYYLACRTHEQRQSDEIVIVILCE